MSSHARGRHRAPRTHLLAGLTTGGQVPTSATLRSSAAIVLAGGLAATLAVPAGADPQDPHNPHFAETTGSSISEPASYETTTEHEESWSGELSESQGEDWRELQDEEWSGSGEEGSSGPQDEEWSEPQDEGSSEPQDEEWGGSGEEGSSGPQDEPSDDNWSDRTTDEKRVHEKAPAEPVSRESARASTVRARSGTPATNTVTTATRELAPARAESSEPAPTRTESRKARPARAESRKARLATAESRELRPAKTETRKARPTRAESRKLAPAKAEQPSRATTGGGVLSVAAGLSGIKYRWGGTTTRGFDCSGFTQHVYRKAGVSLPRTAAAQQRATRRVSNPLPGDLVFFGSPAHHVGIYAGNGRMYDAPRTGKTTGLHKIWSAKVTYGRVR